MFKSAAFVSAAIAAIAVIAPSSAFAYSLNTSVSVSSSTPLVAGLGEVDLTRPSVVEGDLSVDNVSGESFFLTAGNVAGGETGYGFAVKDDRAYAVSNTAGGVPYFLPLGFVHPGASLHVKAVYTPGDAIRVDTSSSDGSWQEYSRGIVLGSLPSAFYSVNAIVAAIGYKFNPANGTVGSWHYGAQ